MIQEMKSAVEDGGKSLDTKEVRCEYLRGRDSGSLDLRIKFNRLHLALSVYNEMKHIKIPTLYGLSK